MSHPAADHASHDKKHEGDEHYRHLLVMTALSFVAMYVLMYAMVDRLANVHNSLNQAYMAGLMAAPMVIIELAVMRAMYKDRRRSIAFAVGASVVLVACWFAIRRQAAIGDRQFLRSMIPHHAGAILMCQQAAVRDAEIQQLCREIIASQQKEIDQMKARLAALR
jgi:uncharacterized protein (DUF305 family)